MYRFGVQGFNDFNAFLNNSASVRGGELQYRIAQILAAHPEGCRFSYIAYAVLGRRPSPGEKGNLYRSLQRMVRRGLVGVREYVYRYRNGKGREVVRKVKLYFLTEKGRQFLQFPHIVKKFEAPKRFMANGGGLNNCYPSRQRCGGDGVVLVFGRVHGRLSRFWGLGFRVVDECLARFLAVLRLVLDVWWRSLPRSRRRSLNRWLKRFLRRVGLPRPTVDAYVYSYRDGELYRKRIGFEELVEILSGENSQAVEWIEYGFDIDLEVDRALLEELREVFSYVKFYFVMKAETLAEDALLRALNRGYNGLLEALRRWRNGLGVISCLLYIGQEHVVVMIWSLMLCSRSFHTISLKSSSSAS